MIHRFIIRSSSKTGVVELDEDAMEILGFDPRNAYRIDEMAVSFERMSADMFGTFQEIVHHSTHQEGEAKR